MNNNSESSLQQGTANKAKAVAAKDEGAKPPPPHPAPPQSPVMIIENATMAAMMTQIKYRDIIIQKEHTDHHHHVDSSSSASLSAAAVRQQQQQQQQQNDKQQRHGHRQRRNKRIISASRSSNQHRTLANVPEEDQHYDSSNSNDSDDENDNNDDDDGAESESTPLMGSGKNSNRKVKKKQQQQQPPPPPTGTGASPAILSNSNNNKKNRLLTLLVKEMCNDDDDVLHDNHNNNNNNNSDSSSNRRRGRNRRSSGLDVNSPPSRHHPRKTAATASAATSSIKEQRIAIMAIAASVVALILCAIVLSLDVLGGGRRGGGIVFHHRDGNNDESTSTDSTPKDPLTLYDEYNRYIIQDYDGAHVLPFSNFLPSLAGYYGKPLYAFYVNRGQGMAAFGIESKQYPILEFNSANKAYQSIPFVGFRTFYQVYSRKGTIAATAAETAETAEGNMGRWGRGKPAIAASPPPQQQQFIVKEPFSPMKTRHGNIQQQLQQSTFLRPKRFMYVGANEMQIQEIDDSIGIETNVTYFILPEEDFGALVRQTTITNINHDTVVLSILDGLAQMEPAGDGGEMDYLLKNMGRTLQGWMGVYSPYNDTLEMPFYKLSTQPSDSASVTIQTAGHWCTSVMEIQNDDNTYYKNNNNDANENNDAGSIYNLPIIYDTSKIFGHDTTLLTPVELYDTTIHDIIRGPQYGFAKTASAFAAVDQVELKAGQSLTITTYFGKANDIMDVPVIAQRLRQEGFAQYKLKRSREVVNQIFANIQTKTSNTLFDLHVQQMFLDNILRGGMPSILGDVDDDAKMRNAEEDSRIKVYHLFSRIHGDLERDYNDFVIKPTFFSAGPGDFRDVIQNRRNDVMFNPRIAAFNVKTFLSLIQADGYNPLSVEAVVFVIRDIETCKRLATRAIGEADGHRAQREALTGILHGGPFRPGQLFKLIEEQDIELLISRQDFIDSVAAAAEYIPMAIYKAGFWSDHWTYLLDLIQTYLAIYPEWEQRIMFDVQLPYFYSPVSVQPRNRKYVLSTSFDGMGKHVRQLDATVWDEDKVEYQNKFIVKATGWYDPEAQWQHDRNATVFRSSPMEKLFLLVTLKFATRDPFGMGIEYEAGRPGWNDANNGLAGMLGSGIPETIELVALLRYIREAVTKFGRSITVPIELAELIEEIDMALDALFTSKEKELDVPQSVLVPQGLFKYWDNVATAREAYREKTRVMYNGLTSTLPAWRVASLLDRWIAEVELGMNRAVSFGSHGDGDNGQSGVTPSYFSYNVTEWETTKLVNNLGHPFVSAKQMVVNRFPLFLEGPTRFMKLLEMDETRDLYEKVKASPLRDQGLGMYTLSASLKGLSFDVGRELAFAPGWLENQSVWLHMSYKFYLELLRHGLFDEFYGEMTSGAMLPFMDPNVYGRSLLECSSFIVSSAFEDPAKRGRGFLARLSGTAAEFLSMWVLMFIGPKPFFIDPGTGKLSFQLVPALPRWMFDDTTTPFTTSTTTTMLDMNAQDPSTSSSSSSSSSSSYVSFKLFGSIDVTYIHNRGEENLYRVTPSRYIVGLRDGQIIPVLGPTLPFDLAEKVRRVVFVDTIDVFFD